MNQIRYLQREKDISRFMKEFIQGIHCLKAVPKATDIFLECLKQFFEKWARNTIPKFLLFTFTFKYISEPY